MKTQFTSIALLMGSAMAVFPVDWATDHSNIDEYTKCGGCIAHGWDFLGLWYTDEDRVESVYGPFQAYDNREALDELLDANSNEGWCHTVSSGWHEGVWFGDEVGNWESDNDDSGVVMWSNKQFSSPHIALAACPFERTRCSVYNSYELSAKDSQNTDVATIENMEAEQACTYKIRATSGAPGFNLQTDMADDNLYVSYVEYDMENVEIDPEFGDYPAFDNEFTFVECGDGCIPGQLLPRVQVINDELESFSMYDILAALEDKQIEIDEYVSLFGVITEWNIKVEEDVFSTAALKEYPPLPMSYDGPSFETTSSQGGYGEPSEGHYHVTTRQRSGWKPFGSAGQSTDHQLSVSLDTQDKHRYMLVSLVPMYEDQSRIQRASLEVGAFEFADYDFTEPQLPFLEFIAGDGSMSLVAGSMAALSLVAMTVY